VKKLLLVFAHTIDESFFVGAMEAKYEKIGWQIERIIAETSLGFNEGTLSKQHPGEVEEPVYRKMVEFVPDLVVTFEPFGITNNPDHKKISRATTFAFQKYAKRANNPKLYYVCLPKSQNIYLRKNKITPTEPLDKSWVGTEDKKITAVIDGEYFYLRMNGTKEAFMGKLDKVSDKL